MDEEKDIKELVRRAKNSVDKTGTLRRDALTRLIELTNSDSSSLKIVAADNIQHFFSDFPDLEESAINAVYDICEDQSSQVRIQGYSAITQLSKMEKRWVKRNADVLLQLLQSDEEEEVKVVKKALVEHIDLDSPVTLGVLCDQITLADAESVDDEDAALRDRLRSLVIAFMTNEARRAIIRRATPKSTSETVLITGIQRAIPSLDDSDLQIIFYDLIVSLPSLQSSPSTPGTALLLALLERAKVSLSKDKSFQMTQTCLDLADVLAVKKRVPPLLELLRFYYTTFAPRRALEKLDPDDLITVLCHLGQALQLPDQDDAQLADMRKKLMDAIPIFFERLQIQIRAKVSVMRALTACELFLKSIKQRKDRGWILPPHILSAVQSLGETIVKADIEQPTVQFLIRHLASRPQDPDSPTNSANRSVEPRRIMKVQKPRETGSSSSSTVSSTRKHGLDQESAPRSPKRAKGDEADAAPSLLSRLHSHGHKERDGNVPRLSAVEDKPSTGFSIKGAAAKLQSSAPPEPESLPRRPPSAPSTSLLGRLNSSGRNEQNGKAAGNRKRKKGGIL
ncbi:hypothetical protein C8J56DRAFT_91215 [Mycena floridula]|nr:hypothetical protein C8J56DRAFT_91215 [Mycena floridula]